MSCLQLNNFG